ncbi:hypothetical protein BJX70DRAFT_183606 [Aspergillus crustosus]
MDKVTGPTLKFKLEELGHDVYLTDDGAKCAQTYVSELYKWEPRFFDVVLMALPLKSATGLKAARTMRDGEESAFEHAPARRRNGNVFFIVPRFTNTTAT